MEKHSTAITQRRAARTIPPAFARQGLGWAIFLALCVAGRAHALPPEFTDTRVASGLLQPIALEFTPDGRMLVAERRGTVLAFPQGGGTPDTVIALDVEAYLEQGLLGMTLDPEYPDSSYLYVVYTSFSGHSDNNFNRVSRFTLNGIVADLASEVVLLDGIPTGRGFHIAGDIDFAPDGRLLVSTGDNGWRNSTYSQDLSRLEGKLLRLERDGSIPPDNPFVGTPGAREEIWQLGLRNPFRFTLQPGTGKVFISDPGSDYWEEIDSGDPGANFGWPLAEGAGVPPPPGTVNPWYTYPDSEFAAVVGAVFYQGASFPAEYEGNLFYLDHPRATIGRIVLDGAGQPQTVTPIWGEAEPIGGYAGPADIAVGGDAALYYTTIYCGEVRRIAYAPLLAAPSRAARAPKLEAWPNPSLGSTWVRFGLTREGRARVAVVDLSGRRVRALADGALPAGRHEVVWDGRDDAGRTAPPGLYLVTCERPGSTPERALIVRLR